VAARKQRGDLIGVDGVVQHDEYPLVRDQTSVQIGGLVVAVDTQGIEEPAEHIDRMHRPFGGTEAVQVREQLSVREMVQVAVGPGQGQPGLADPPGATDHGDSRVDGVGAAVEVRQMIDTADKPVRHRGQLPWQR